MSSVDRKLVILAVGLLAAVSALWLVAGLWPSNRSEDEALRGTAADRDAGPAAEAAVKPAAITSGPAPAIEVQPRPEQPTSLPGVEESGYLDAAGAFTTSVDPMGSLPTSIQEEPAGDGVPIPPELSPTGAALDGNRHALPAEVLNPSPTSVPWDDRLDAGAEPSPPGVGSSPTEEPDASPGSGASR